MTGPRQFLACAAVLAGAVAVAATQPLAGGAAEKARPQGVSDGVITYGQLVQLSCDAPSSECSGPVRNSIRIVSPRGGPTRRLPTWSRDGRKLAFVSFLDGKYG